MELELTKTEKTLLIAMISLVAFLILRNYYSKKEQEESFRPIKWKWKLTPFGFNWHH